MYSNIQDLRKSLKQSLYKRTLDNRLVSRVDDLANELKTQDRFKSWDIEDVKTYALSRLQLIATKEIGLAIQNNAYTMNRPSDPTWDEYSYEEILAMASNGCNVPQEILDWAHEMADKDTMAYEIDNDSSCDYSSISELDIDSGSTNETEQMHKLQKYYTKATAQNELTEEKQQKVDDESKILQNKQSKLDSEQKNLADEISRYTKEFSELDKKIATGETVTDEELRRYKELGTYLSLEQSEIITESSSIEDELNTLVNSMNEMKSLSEINTELSNSLKILETSYTNRESKKNNSGVLVSKTGFTIGDINAIQFATAGSNLSISSTIANVNLETNTNELLKKTNNANTFKEVVLQGRNNIADKTVEPKTPKDTEGTEDSSKNATVNPTGEDDNNEVNDNETSTATTTEGTEDNTSPVNSTQNTTEGTSTTENTNGTDEVGKTGETTKTTDSTEATEGTEGTEATEETEENATTGGNDLETSAREHYQGASEKDAEVSNIRRELSKSGSEAKKVYKSMQLKTTMIRARQKKKLKEYTQLLKIAQSDKGLNNSQMTRYEELRRELDTENGAFAKELTSQITTLSAFTEQYDLAKESVAPNIEYGKATIKAGKVLAKSEFFKPRKSGIATVIDETKHLPFNRVKSLAKVTISAGKSLIKDTLKLNRVIAFSKDTYKNSNKRITSLTNVLTENNNRVDSINAQFAEVLPKEQDQTSANNPEDKQTPGNTDNASDSDVSDVKADGTDAQTITQEAETQKQEAEKDLKTTEKETKQNTTTQNKFKSQINTLNQNMNVNVTRQAELGQQAEALNNEIGLSDEKPSPETDTANDAKVTELNAIVAENDELEQSNETDGKNISNIENQAEKLDDTTKKDCDKKTETVTKELEKNQTRTGARDILYDSVLGLESLFKNTQKAGFVLLLNPFTTSAGLTLINIGTAGITYSTATQALLDITKISLLSSGLALTDFNKGIALKRSSSLLGTKELTKETAKTPQPTETPILAEGTDTESNEEEATPQAMEDKEQDAGETIAEDSGNEVATDAELNASSDVEEELNTTTTTTIAQNAAAETNIAIPKVSPVEVSAIISTNAVEGLQATLDNEIKEITKDVAEEVIQNIAKSTAAENVKAMTRNDILEASKSGILNHGEQLQQKDSKEEIRRKLFTEFERKKQDEIRKGVQKVNASARMKH